MEKLSVLEQDYIRYASKKDMPTFQKFFRRAQMSKGVIVRFLNRAFFKYYKDKAKVEIYWDCEIGAGLYLGHAYGITINPKARIGRNCNIHKGVTIGQENRGVRKGTPVIGDEVWIGVNATIVGNIVVGNDVLIAPNSYVNCNIPSHSVVYGNPCIIKSRDNATEDYINRKIAL